MPVLGRKAGFMHACLRAVKQLVSRRNKLVQGTCIHIHMLLCWLSNEELETNKTVQVSSKKESVDKVVKDSLSCQSTRWLYENFYLPYEIGMAFIKKNRELDSKTYLSQFGWQDVFEPSEVCCGLCNSGLGSSRPHTGLNGNGILLTFQNPFLKNQNIGENLPQNILSGNAPCISNQA